ncbi:MAG: hypothetical protein WC868_03415 [Bacteroidales bacterium]
MNTIVVRTKTISEFNLLKELLKKMRITSKVLTEEEKEDIGLLKLMQEADRTEKVPKDTVIAKLRKK